MALISSIVSDCAAVQLNGHWIVSELLGATAGAPYRARGLFIDLGGGAPKNADSCRKYRSKVIVLLFWGVILPFPATASDSFNFDLGSGRFIPVNGPINCQLLA